MDSNIQYKMEHLPLLMERASYVFDSNIELTQDSIKRMIEERKRGRICDCDICGRDLGTPYYVSIGIPPSPLIIETFKSRNLKDEDNLNFDITVSEIQAVAKTYDINSEYQWIFSQQNIMSSKTRICIKCVRKYKWRRWCELKTSAIYRREVCGAVEEYQRLHTPIDAAKSDFERYVISLPDRSNMQWKPYYDNHKMNVWEEVECLTVALIPGYKPTILKELPQDPIIH